MPFSAPCWPPITHILRTQVSDVQEMLAGLPQPGLP